MIIGVDEGEIVTVGVGVAVNGIGVSDGLDNCVRAIAVVIWESEGEQLVRNVIRIVQRNNFFIHTPECNWLSTTYLWKKSQKFPHNQQF